MSHLEEVLKVLMTQGNTRRCSLRNAFSSRALEVEEAFEPFISLGSPLSFRVLLPTFIFGVSLVDEWSSALSQLHRHLLRSSFLPTNRPPPLPYGSRPLPFPLQYLSWGE